MTSKIFNKAVMFSGLAAIVLSAGQVASADKAAKPAKSCAACCMPKQKKQSAKATGAKMSATKPAAAKAAAPAKAPASAGAAKKTVPAGSAGWIYREPGSPRPQPLTTKSVIVPHIRAAKDPRDGMSMTLPPLTASVANVDAKGHVNCDCVGGAAHSHKAGKSHK